MTDSYSISISGDSNDSNFVISSENGNITDDSNANQDLTTLNTDVSTLNTHVSTLNTDVATLKSDVTTLKSHSHENESLVSRIASLELTSNVYNSDISNLKAFVNEEPWMSQVVDVSTSGLALPFWSWTPENYASMKADGKKMPLIVQIHGGGETFNANTVAASTGIGPAKMATTFSTEFHGTEKRKVSNWRENWMIVAPHNYADFATTTPEQKNMDPSAIKLTIEYMIANYPVDPSKIYMTGVSLGGIGTLRYLATYPTSSHIAAAVSLCPVTRDKWWWGGSDKAFADYKACGTTVPVYIIYGDNDNVMGDLAKFDVLRSQYTTNNTIVTGLVGYDHNVWEDSWKSFPSRSQVIGTNPLADDNIPVVKDTWQFQNIYEWLKNPVEMSKLHHKTSLTQKRIDNMNLLRKSQDIDILPSESDISFGMRLYIPNVALNKKNVRRVTPQMKQHEKVPAIVVLHGNGAGKPASKSGEIDLESLQLLDEYGPGHDIASNRWNKEWIVLQLQSTDWGQFADTSSTYACVQYLINNYPVDTTAIYMTGWSGGGGGVMRYLTDYPMNNQIAGAVVTCPYNPGRINEYVNSTNTTRVWQLAATDDEVGSTIPNMIKTHESKASGVIKTTISKAGLYDEFMNHQTNLKYKGGVRENHELGITFSYSNLLGVPLDPSISILNPGVVNSEFDVNIYDWLEQRINIIGDWRNNLGISNELYDTSGSTVLLGHSVFLLMRDPYFGLDVSAAAAAQQAFGNHVFIGKGGIKTYDVVQLLTQDNLNIDASTAILTDGGAPERIVLDFGSNDVSNKGIFGMVDNWVSIVNLIRHRFPTVPIYINFPMYWTDASGNGYKIVDGKINQAYLSPWGPDPDPVATEDNMMTFKAILENKYSSDNTVHVLDYFSKVKQLILDGSGGTYFMDQYGHPTPKGVNEIISFLDTNIDLIETSANYVHPITGLQNITGTGNAFGAWRDDDLSGVEYDTSNSTVFFGDSIFGLMRVGFATYTDTSNLEQFGTYHIIGKGGAQSSAASQVLIQDHYNVDLSTALLTNHNDDPKRIILEFGANDLANGNQESIVPNYNAMVKIIRQRFKDVPIYLLTPFYYTDGSGSGYDISNGKFNHATDTDITEDLIMSYAADLSNNNASDNVHVLDYFSLVKSWIQGGNGGDYFRDAFGHLSQLGYESITAWLHNQVNTIESA